MGEALRFTEVKYRRIVKITTLIVNVALLPVLIMNALISKHLIVLMILGLLLIANFGWLYFVKTRKYNVWSSIIVLVAGFACAAIFAEGGLEGAGHLWAFVFPLLAYELKGPKEANKFIIPFFFGLLGIFVVISYLGVAPAYQTYRFIVVYFIVFAAVTVFLYQYEKRRFFSESAATENEKKFKTLFNNLSLGVVMLDTDLRVVESNQKMKSWFPELLTYDQLYCYKTFHPENKGLPCKDCPAKSTFFDGQTHTLEQVKNTSNGRRVYRIVSNPMFDEKGNVFAVIETLEDITDQKRIEEEIRSREEKFRSLVSSLSDVVFSLDTEMRHTGVYGDWVEKAGLTKEYFLGRTTEEIMGLEYARVHIAANQRALKGENVVYEWSTVFKGENSYYQTSLSPIRDKDNTITGIVGVARDISGIKKSELYLLDANERFQQLASQSRTITWEINEAGIYTFISPVVEEILGYTPEEIIGKKYYYDLFPDDKRDYYRKEIEEKLYALDSFVDFKNELQAKDGSVVQVSSNSLAICDDSGKLLGFRGVDRDITKQLELENAIKYNSRMQQMLSETSGLFVASTRQDMGEKVLKLLEITGTFFHLDSACYCSFAQNTPLSASELEWVKPSANNPSRPDSNGFSGLRWMFADISDGNPVIVDDVVQLPDEIGGEREILICKGIRSLACFPVSAEGVVVGFLAFKIFSRTFKWNNEEVAVLNVIARIVSDAMGKYMADEALARSERTNREMALRYQAFIDASNTGAWEYSHETGFLWCSPQYMSMLGFTIDDFDFSGAANAQEIWQTLIHPDDLAQFRTSFSFYLKNPNGNLEQYYRMLHKKGHYRWILSRGRLLTEETATTAKVLIGTNIDITLQKESEETIRLKNKELESYLYVASHDLRTPLVNIQGFSNRILKHTGRLHDMFDDSENKGLHLEKMEKIIRESFPQSLSFILSNVKKMDSLINGLLTISRTGRVKMNLGVVNVDQLVASVLDQCSFQLREIGATVEKNTLPSCFGDGALLSQLFSNLIDNAIKYRDPARPLSLHIDAIQNNTTVTYRVADNGIGMNQHDLAKIWDVFYRVDQGMEVNGDGIGLNLVGKIVEKHKGQVWAESVPQQGSTFFVKLNQSPFQD